MVLDIRTKLLVMLLTATCVSLNNNVAVEIGMMLILSLLLILCTKNLHDLWLLLLYFGFVAIEFLVFPVVPDTVSMLLSMPVVNIRGFFPVLLCVFLIYKTTEVSQMMATFTKMHIPKKLIITLAVAVRYIPSLIEEWHHIRDAMAVRNVTGGIRNPVRRILLRGECYLVPLFISMIRTADGLSAAAIARGIDEPVTPTCRRYTRLRAIDYLMMTAAIALTAGCFYFTYFRG
ncbi:MAG: energy-coupling factor transporter transmembrane protein EcfT [Oscillospiraceae bacterium]|nr:energy-coupling factor transporter transmembrane protein EcfT [Oscillospiraceae bacterium]